MDAVRGAVPPPESPVLPKVPIDWDEVEGALGTRLPADYKQYVRVYGAGGFHYGAFTFLFPYVPFGGRLALVEWTERVLAGYRPLHSEWPIYFPYSAFPNRGGLLPWGRTDNGQDLFWVTEGEPDEWTIAIADHEVEAFPLSMTGFLAGWICGTIQPRFVPDLPLESLVFNPVELE